MHVAFVYFTVAFLAQTSAVMSESIAGHEKERQGIMLSVDSREYSIRAVQSIREMIK
jgi:hypothetical protein